MRILWKLYLGYVALVLATVLGVGVLDERWLVEDFMQELERDLEGHTLLLAEIARDALAGGDPAGLPDRVRRVGRTLGGGTRLTVLRADGSVFADSESDPRTMDNHTNRPEILGSTKTRGTVTVIRHSHTVGETLVYSARPVYSGGQRVGHVRASLSIEAVDARLWLFRKKLLAAGSLALVVALVAGFFLARSLTDPLTVMTRAAHDLAEGSLEVTLPVRRGRDELGTLSRALESMATQLRVRFHLLESDRSKLTAILSSMVEGVVAVDTNERVLHMNAVAERILRAKAGWEPGALLWEVTRVPDVSELLEHTLREGVSSCSQVRLEALHGDTLLEVHTAPLRVGDGGVAGAVIVLHDVTELRRLEAHRRDFVANVSHELKTPLTAIYGLVDTLLEDPNMDETTRRRFLEKAHKQASRLSTLVRDILTLSKLESGDESLAREVFDLRESLRESLLQSSAERKGVALAISLPDDPVRIRGDREALRQVFDNLLDNAVKYAPSGGRAGLSLVVEEGRAKLEVTDTGSGIPAAHLERIFERFYRVDKARSRELGGTGLGLSIVKHVVSSHGGDVSVESEVGVGSTFRVSLPLAVVTDASATG